MKIGDNIICIKENRSNKKNRIYKIRKIEPNSITVTTEDMTHKNLLSSRSYYIDTKYDKWSKFSEHFISLSEYRKRKLNKINTIKDNLNLYIKHKCDDIQ